MARFAILTVLAASLFLSHHHPSGLADETKQSAKKQELKKPSERSYRSEALLPKTETGAVRFLKANPKFDGRGVIVAIFDTGVDPGAAGLRVTSDGKPKVIDIIDATGSGDVMMSDEVEPEDGKLTGQTGRTLAINKKWKNPSGKYRLGLKAGFDLFPAPLVSRLKKERLKKWNQAQRKREADLLSQLEDKSSSIDKKELQARIDVLRSAQKDFEDPGPIFDCVTFHDGKNWQAVIDTDEDGDLADEELLTDYKVNQKFANFGDASKLNFSVNLYENGKLLSIVTTTGSHGTHVAGIVGANYPENPQRNGLAPGVQFISVSIGDSRLGGMETGTALIRGLKRVAEMKCDLINMSFGEQAALPNQGRLIEEFNKIVRDKGVIFVSSAGNSGPALTTVGAPGGTSSAVIGVGAYVSPEMAKQEYSLHEAVPGLPYTWTSRGPTADGDWGVDLFAPGGAVAPVPAYTLQPSQRMNGTSMASPNACGNIALMLSGLKQEGKEYTPFSIQRSLQATSAKVETVDKLAQGPGLVQIDKAYAHQLEQASAAEAIEIDVEISSRSDARGIYIREEFEMKKSVGSAVQVKPRFHDSELKDNILEFEIPITLSVDADWVSVGSQLLLTNGGASFGVIVDATGLKPGLHTAEVVGVHAEHPERGPLFRVPIVVTKPEKLSSNEFKKKIKSNAGTLVRTFLTPPIGSRYAELKLTRKSGNGSGFFYLHNLQLVPSESFETHETKSTTSLSPGEVFVKKIPVVAERTLEVCLSQYWSSLGESDLELEVSFGGIEPSLDMLTLPSRGDALPLDLTARLQFERVKLSGSLTRWQRQLSPVKSDIELLSDERDGLWDDQGTWKMLLEYKFELASKAKIQLSNPLLTPLIYSSPVDAHFIQVFDKNQRPVHTDDMFPADFSAESGEYLVRVELRHLDRNALKKYEQLPLVIEQPTGRVGLKFFESRLDAIQNIKAQSSAELTVGEQVRFWLNLPLSQSLPKGVSNGDVLVGEVSLSGDDPNPIPVRHVVSSVTTKVKAEAKTTPVTDLVNAEQKFLLESLRTLDWSKHQPQIEEISDRLKELGKSDRQLHVARLHLADSVDRKERLGVVVELADEVIDSVKTNKLARYFGRKHSPKTAEEKKLHQEMEAAKRDLIDALYRKERALAYHELPDVLAKHPIEDQEKLDRAFEKNFRELSSWVDTTSKEYFLLHSRRDRREGNYAQAMQLLNKHSGAGQPVYLYHKKRRDLYELLGWKDWQQSEQNWMLRYFPEGPPKP